MDKPLPAKLTTTNTPLAGQIEALKAQLIEAEQRAAVAEALAEERSRRIEDLRRMLPSPEAVEGSTKAQSKGFWARLIGKN